jgi:hypothetical protein
MSAGSTCSGSLVTPTTAGQYGVTITVTDSSGDQSTNLTTIQVGTTPAPTATATPPPTGTPPPSSTGTWTFLSIGTPAAGSDSCIVYLNLPCSTVGATVNCYDQVNLLGSGVIYMKLQCK